MIKFLNKKIYLIKNKFLLIEKKTTFNSFDFNSTFCPKILLFKNLIFNKKKSINKNFRTISYLKYWRSGTVY